MASHIFSRELLRPLTQRHLLLAPQRSQASPSRPVCHLQNPPLSFLAKYWREIVPCCRTRSSIGRRIFRERLAIWMSICLRFLAGAIASLALQSSSAPAPFKLTSSDLRLRLPIFHYAFKSDPLAPFSVLTRLCTLGQRFRDPCLTVISSN